MFLPVRAETPTRSETQIFDNFPKSGRKMKRYF